MRANELAVELADPSQDYRFTGSKRKFSDDMRLLNMLLLSKCERAIQYIECRL